MNVVHPHVAAVIVTFEYEPARLDELIRLVEPQVGQLILVDNNSMPLAISQGLYGNIRCVANRQNLGLAAALNQGISAALDADFEQVLLLDQDSRPAPTMLDGLLDARCELAERGIRVAAVGPAIYETARQSYLPFIRYQRLTIKHVPVAQPATLIGCDMLLTSGTLIDAAAISQIGAMDESLFIYAVDTEWCLRAKECGYSLYGVTNAHLDHCLGEGVKNLPFGIGPLFVHSPERQYFIARNYVWLLRRSGVPLNWKLAYFPRILARWLLFSLVTSPRGRNFLCISKGLWHGISKPNTPRHGMLPSGDR